jgi:putative endonuclease
VGRERIESGGRGEDRAARALRERGYRLVERNFRCKQGELDAVAYDGDTLVFVEVRTRRDARFGGGASACGVTKQRRVARVAAAYVSLRRPRFDRCRFDVVAITGDDLEIIQDAFRVVW